MAIFRLLVFAAGVTSLDIEARRWPALSIIMRANSVIMITTISYANPLLYLHTRKNLRTSLEEVFPWLRRRVRKVGVVAEYSAG